MLNSNQDQVRADTSDQRAIERDDYDDDEVFVIEMTDEIEVTFDEAETASSSNADETTSVRTILTMFQHFTFLLDSPLLKKLEKRLQTEVWEITYCADYVKKIPTAKAGIALKSALDMIVKPSIGVQESEKWGLKEVLKIFRAVTLRIGLGSRSLSDLQLQVKRCIQEATLRETKVTILQIKNAVESALNIVMS